MIFSSKIVSILFMTLPEKKTAGEMVKESIFQHGLQISGQRPLF